ncbi:hypothetical protein MKQ68_14995 [Chitinophaga horti]|uniref:Uncharacterized protein n=1 Tax=Chitinophaga horti TaxID=2920382 RepID=A0ABY6IVL0_9BACT|nr:hypothetical protein [Chitinophaga horti]UYQ91399.1 hypothetical protein MKQ68_14995 [Chitinophaga horti]
MKAIGSQWDIYKSKNRLQERILQAEYFLGIVFLFVIATAGKQTSALVFANDHVETTH